MKIFSYKFLLALILVLMAVILLVSYIHWQELLMFSQYWQRTFHQLLTQFLTEVKANPWQTGYLLTGLSLLYGILHSAGPGHGKFIITTYLATQPSKLKRSLYLTLFSAIMQGIVAIFLVTLFLIIFKVSRKQLELSEYWLELLSYVIVIVIGFLLSYRALKKIREITQQNQSNKNRPKILKIESLKTTKSPNLLLNQPIMANHQHANNCHCGHRHLPTNAELNNHKHWYNDLAIIISIGIRPCSGALLVLFFSHVIGVYLWGIIATIAMSIGTAITTSCFALLVYCARKVAEKLITTKFSQTHYRVMVTSHFIAVIGSVLFIMMGVILMAGLNLQSPTITNPLLG